MSPNNTERAHHFAYPTVTPVDILSPHHKEHHPAVRPFGEPTEIPQGGYEHTTVKATSDIAQTAVSQVVKPPYSIRSERFEAAA